ncbi:hypothetical protein BDD12DRAFT_933191, partial [Trichophaea hybrida]
HLQDRSLNVKTLLTSRPQDDIKVLLNGLPCIEYDSERKECFSTLHFHNTRYDKISKEYEGSLEWLWEHSQFKQWSASKNTHLLYIEGKPGSGKSTLTKYFKDNLQKRETNANSAIIACFFYSFREGEHQRNHYNMLRSILHDILFQNEYFFHFQEAYRNMRAQRDDGGLGPSGCIWHYKALKEVLLSLGNYPIVERIYLVIDAVDESDEEDRREVIQLLFNLCPKDHSIIKVFVASLPVVKLECHIKNFGVIRMQDVNEADIRSFTHSFLSTTDFPANTLLFITDYIVKHAQRVFLWVNLVCDQLRRFAMEGCTKNEIIHFLKSLLTELEGLYKRILEDLERG